MGNTAKKIQGGRRAKPDETRPSFGAGPLSLIFLHSLAVDLAAAEDRLPALGAVPVSRHHRLAAPDAHALMQTAGKVFMDRATTHLGTIPGHQEHGTTHVAATRAPEMRRP